MNIKIVLGILLGFLFLWIGLTGKLGSLLGAILYPDAMVDSGTSSTSTSSTQTPTQAAASQVNNVGQVVGQTLSLVSPGLGTAVQAGSFVGSQLAQTGGQIYGANEVPLNPDGGCPAGYYHVIAVSGKGVCRKIGT
jgi:hypothetical protein